MREPDFRDRRPQPGDTMLAYAARLESAGHDEMFIRKGLAANFGMRLEEMPAFFEDFPAARLRHVERLMEAAPNRTEYSLTVEP